MRVITISGRAQVGKDSIAQALKETFDSQGIPCLIFHYADFLKKICEVCYGWDGKKDEKGRSLLQHVGTEIFRAADPDIWVDMMLCFVKGISKTTKVLILPDVRFLNEAIKLKNSLYVDGVFSILVERDSYDNGLTTEQKKHPSENGMAGYDFDIVVKNDKDLQAFLAKAKEIVNYYNLSQKKEIPVI